MSGYQEKILLVEDDPEVCDLVAQQVLRPLGYRVKTINTASIAVQEALRYHPDIILVGLDLPGLSGKDLLVALSAQGVKTPVIVIAEEGMEMDVIQAFRLGASDYLASPIREAEVVSAVERALTQVRARRERERLARQLEKTNQELKNRIRDLSTILKIGKVVTSTTDQRKLFDQIIQGAVFITEADKGWLLLHHKDTSSFVLEAEHQMPRSIASLVGKPWDDGISSLVALSGESLSIHGTPLKRFKVAHLGQAALVVPIKVKEEVVGLLVVMREASKPFTSANQTMLEGLADYASIALVNIRLFHAIEEQARSLRSAARVSKENEQMKARILHHARMRLETPLKSAVQQVVSLAKEHASSLSPEQLDGLRVIQKNLEKALRVVEALNLLEQASAPRHLVKVDLVKLAQEAIARFKGKAEAAAVNLRTEFPDKPVYAQVDVGQIARVFDALLSNAIRFGLEGEVIVKVDRKEGGDPCVLVQDSGMGVAKSHHDEIFQPFYQAEPAGKGSHPGMGIGLALAREIARAHGGDLRLQNHTGKGAIFSLTLKAAD